MLTGLWITLPMKASTDADRSYGKPAHTVPTEKLANPVPQRPLSDLRVLKVESCIRYNYTV